MVQLFPVYAPDGEMFEVLPSKAKELVINNGWSLEPPQEKAATLPQPAKPKGRAAPVEEVGANDGQAEIPAGV